MNDHGTPSKEKRALTNALGETTGIVSTSRYGTLKLWDRETGAELATLAGYEGRINACAFSPDGSRIVSGTGDGTLKLWDGATGVELATLAEHRGLVTACAFSPDGRRIVSASRDGTLKLWDGVSGAELATLARYMVWVTTCAFSPDGAWVSSGSRGGTLRLWDASSGQEGCRYWPGVSVNAVSFSPNGRRLVVGTEVGSVHLLQLKNLLVGPPIITLWRWRRRSSRWQFWRHAEEPSHAIGCPLCRVWSEVPASALDTELSCPHCGGRLKLNPFTIDADWRPVANAGRGRRR